MSSNFLTVEDVNSINTQHINEFYTLDTSKISEQEFEDVLYDFVKVSHSISGSNHTFTFEIHNTLWCGGYCFVKSNNTVLSSGITFDSQTKTITLVTSESHIILKLYLCSYPTSFNFSESRYVIITPELNLKKNELGKNIGDTGHTYQMIDFKGIITEDDNLVVNKGVTTIPTPAHDLFLLVNMIKSDLIFDLDSNLTVGKVNHVRLNVDEKFLPKRHYDPYHPERGDLVGDEKLNIIAKYGKVEIPVNQICDETDDSIVIDYGFDLDLTNKTDNKPIEVSLKVYEDEYVNPLEENFILSCHYESADSFQKLQSLIASTTGIIHLDNSIDVSSNIFLNYDCLIQGNEYDFDLDEYTIFVGENVTVKLQNINFVNGSPVIVQSEGSKLIVNDCDFTNAKISDEYKGSVLSTLDDENIESEFNNVNISECPHSIWHNGKLLLNNMTAIYHIYNNVDTDYSMLLTMANGTIEINNSHFDISFETDALWQNQIDIKYAQSLISIGETAQLNTVLGNELKDNNSLNFLFNNNFSHTQNYYYHEYAESRVRAKPLPGYENKSCCHHVIGTDFVFKNNVQVERW